MVFARGGMGVVVGVGGGEMRKSGERREKKREKNIYNMI